MIKINRGIYKNKNKKKAQWPQKNIHIQDFYTHSNIYTQIMNQNIRGLF